MGQSIVNTGAITGKAWAEPLVVWSPLIVGLFALYIPTLFDLVTGLWSADEYSHGPIILALSIWLILRRWPIMLQFAADKQGTAAGWPLCLFALLLYIVGRSQSILMLEIGSLIVLLTAILLIVWGGNALKAQWFPLLFMVFMVPLPATVVDAVTMPMKTAVSYVTEYILFWAGYPISRSGVILQVGQYQLLVADACAGLQTLLSLEALGLFYLNVVRCTSALRNVALAIMIVPISFAANVIRVVILTLITYHLGDAAGQGFLHGFAGIVLFVSALLLTIGVDSLLRYGDKRMRGQCVMPNEAQKT